ncbi:MAG: DUF3781 domain-containing protein [Oscillospiraceae bacterium]|nr:DUF3781 domain-containing protein [Oscillospiraceae bacterium]MDE7093326.1 DUF3781 domain-containing protein [Oscillospiraceae bacterium]
MSDLIKNISKLHTTELGIERIKKNLKLELNDVIAFCRAVILDNHTSIYQKGKNWYAVSDDYIITINAHSYTVITVHKVKK